MDFFIHSYLKENSSDFKNKLLFPRGLICPELSNQIHLKIGLFIACNTEINKFQEMQLTLDTK